MGPASVRFEGITKRFPGVLALSDVSLEIAPGSCHALCGENGAGKSTLGKILAGIHASDSGRLLLDGKAVRFNGPRDALAAGIGMVHQELAFCPQLTVAENLCLGDLPATRGFVSRSTMAQRATAMLAGIGAVVDVGRPIGELTIAQQQVVQIAAAVAGGARVIVFDEPTSSLSQVEAEQLYALIQRLREGGVTCIYVSHRMAELFRLCDSVSVLRDGRHVATRPVEGLSEGELVQMMIGRPVAEYFPATLAAEPGEKLLQVKGLSLPGRFDGVDFTIRAGEVLGLAGLVGAGRSDIAEALFGLRPHVQGRVTVRGKRVRIRTPRDAIREGIGLVPEDRKRQALVPWESVLHNISLAILRRLSVWSWIDRARERATGQDFADRLTIRARDLDADVVSLSGGNQQKVVLARWLAAGSRVLLLDEPTRGVDVGAKAEIHALIAALVAGGNAVLLISSELPELLSLSQRILVLRAGRVVGEIRREDATQDGLLRLMAGIGDAA